MSAKKLARLKFLSLLFLLPGLVGLVISAAISTFYLDSLPRTPVPDEYRMMARNIHGTIVYQTEEEDRRLTWMEDGSVSVFVIGLGFSLVFFEKWGSMQSEMAEADEEEFSEQTL